MSLSDPVTVMIDTEIKTIKYLVLCIIAFTFLSGPRAIQGKVYTKCGLTQELLNKGFSRTFVGNWVCLVESESGKDTAKVTTRARGKGLGLFQINDKDWCAYGRPGGKCNMKCEDLINEDITDDSSCAKKVHGELGFKGWNGWIRSCKNRTLPLPNC